MRGLVPGIHAAERRDVSRSIFERKYPTGSALADVDAGNKPGHDAEKTAPGFKP
jgi:hypothetical protein